MHLMFIPMPWTAACHLVVTSVYNTLDGYLISNGYRFSKNKWYFCHPHWFICYWSGLKTNLNVQLVIPQLEQKILQDSAFQSILRRDFSSVLANKKRLASVNLVPLLETIDNIPRRAGCQARLGMFPGLLWLHGESHETCWTAQFQLAGNWHLKLLKTAALSICGTADDSSTSNVQ